MKGFYLIQFRYEIKIMMLQQQRKLGFRQQVVADQVFCQMNRHPDLTAAQLEGELQQVFIPEGTVCDLMCKLVCGGCW